MIKPSSFTFMGEKFKKNSALLYLLAVAVSVKVYLFIWASNYFNFIEYPQYNFLNIWYRWDSLAYITIATNGYSRAGLALDYFGFLSHFPPLYPILISLSSLILNTDKYFLGSLISIICCLLTTWYLYKLVFLETKNTRTSSLAVIFYLVFPISYFTNVPYSDSLFILLSVLVFYSLRRDKLILSGFFAFLGIMTRTTGILFLPLFAFYILQNWSLGWKKNCINSLKLFILPSMSVFGYLLINKIYYGDFLFFINEYKTNVFTGKVLIVPFSETFNAIKTLLIGFSDSITSTYFMFSVGWNSIFVLICLLIIIYGFNKIPKIYTFFSATSLLFIASYGWGISNSRYVFAIFPIYYSLALIKNKYVVGGLIAISLIGLLYFVPIFTSGAWGF